MGLPIPQKESAMSSPLKIVTLLGSLRQGSYNAAIAHPDKVPHAV